MSQLVLLRGVNVGGHRSFRPAALAQDLAALGVVNIGAAGTFVVRKTVAAARLRGEFARRLPFEIEIVICRGRDVLDVVARSPFAEQPVRRDIVPFVSVLSRPARLEPPLPAQLPASGRWLLRIAAREGRFVFGEYRREMQAIGLLGRIDGLFGVPATTRNWNTFRAIARALGDGAA